MRRHIVFVTTEFDPLVPGGAGAVVAGLVPALRAQGHSVTVVLVTDLPVDPKDDVVLVRSSFDPDQDLPALGASKAAHTALMDLVERGPIDLIEFQDFDGLAFWTLAHRTDTPLESTRIAVRYHLPADHILDAIGVERPEFDAVRAMERSCLRSTDIVVAQTASMAEVVADRYGIEVDRVVVGPPPVLDVGRVAEGRSATPRLVVVGRLSEQKGTHDCVRALFPLLREHPGAIIEFLGSDGWSATADLPMREWVRGLAPDDVQDQIVFTDPLSRDDIPAHLSGTWAVLVPSRLESFCLAAHEARAMGLPLIARNLPPITDYFGEKTGALIYDGTDSDFRRVVAAALDAPETLDRLADAPLPTYGDPTGIYSETLPAPRHPHSQAGHATASIHTVETALAPPVNPQGASAAAQRALAILPPSVARAAMRIVPGRLKDRFRSVASWPAEEERRRFVDRQSAIDARIQEGAFPDLADPRVSVVIPCYNHGEFLAGALLSVFEQAYSSWEVVVVDDGSTDPETIGILDALDLPRVRVIRQANTGLPGARNSGIREARGEYVTPLDADDQLLPGYLAAMTDALNRDTGAAFAHCWAELFGDVNWVWATRPYNPYTVLLSNSVLQVATFRRAAWQAVGGYDETMTHGNEDWDFWLRLQETGWGNIEIRKPLYRYRKQGISMSVDTEADFERGRERIRERHLGLYEPSAIRRAKAQHYPLLSLVVGAADAEASAAIAMDDIQIVVGVGERCADVADARGKYVAFWNGESADVLAALVDELERSPNLGAATDGSATVFRRWELVDAQTGLSLGSVPEPERCHEAGWSVPAEMVVEGRSLPVVRQRPEEEGRMPAWVTDR